MKPVIFVFVYICISCANGEISTDAGAATNANIATTSTQSTAQNPTTEEKCENCRVFGFGPIRPPIPFPPFPIPPNPGEQTTTDAQVATPTRRVRTTIRTDSRVLEVTGRPIVFGADTTRPGTHPTNEPTSTQINNNQSSDSNNQNTTIAIAATQARNTSTSHQLNPGYRLCGYPVICDQDACLGMYESASTLSECAQPGGEAVFGAFVVLLALIIVIGNSLLPVVVWQNRDMRTQHNLMKVSLAFADMIIGLILLLSALPNMVWTMRATERELVENDAVTKNLPVTVLAGAMLTLSVQASLFHLTYMSVERFIAIKWQLWHRGRRTRTIILQITAIWILSIICSCTPAAVSENFSFRYIPVVFLHMMTVENPTAGTVYLILTMVIPFVCTVVFSTLTGLVVWRKMKSTAHMKSYSTKRGASKNTTGKSYNRGTNGKVQAESGTNQLKPEVAVFKTTTIMVIAFCCTIAPFIAVASLYNSGYYDCFNYTVPYAGSFYACISNSIVNVVIYTMRDKKFRAGLRRIFVSNKQKSRSTRTTRKNATLSTNLSAPNSRRPSAVPGVLDVRIEPSK